MKILILHCKFMAIVYCVSWSVKEVKLSLRMSLVAHQAGAYPIARLPPALNLLVPVYICGWKVALRE